MAKLIYSMLTSPDGYTKDEGGKFKIGERRLLRNDSLASGLPAIIPRDERASAVCSGEAGMRRLKQLNQKGAT